MVIPVTFVFPSLSIQVNPRFYKCEVTSYYLCCRYHLQTSLFMKLSILDFVLSYLLKFSPSRDACNPLSTMASADFSSFVVTTASYSVSTADETSLGTTHFFPSIYLPHLLFTVPYSYWASICYAILPPYIA